MKPSLIVAGAGVSGLSVARFLNDFANVTIIEKAEKPGGLIKCDHVNGALFHKVGGHVFNAKNKKVFDWFWSNFDQEKEFIKAKRNARILFQNKIIGYPFENYLHQLEKPLVERIIKELLLIHNREKKSPFEYDNFEEFLKGNFGETLFDIYFQPYNSKIWNTDLKKVAMEWLEGKLPMPNIEQIITSNIIKEEESSMVHSSFFYPVKGGSQFIADRLAKGLKINFGTEVNSIRKVSDKFIINDSIKTDYIVYTGDIRKLSSIYITSNGEIKEALNSVETLQSNGTSNFLCECDPNDYSWLYIPESTTKAHRVIYTGNFSKNNNPDTDRRTCVVEFSGKVDPEIMKEEIKILPGNLKPLSFNYEPNSYVIQQKGTREKVDLVKTLLEKDGLFLTGRFAEWEYYNMDKAIEASMVLSEKIQVMKIVR